MDIEIQRSSSNELVKRAGFYSSVLESTSLKAGDDYRSKPDTYVIVLTEHDFLKTGEEVTEIYRAVRKNGRPFGDGNYILFIDGSYQVDDPIGRLIHDFKCSDPSKKHNKVLRDRVRMFKETAEGVKVMSGTEEKIAKRAEAKGRAEGIAVGEVKEKERFILNLLRNGVNYEQIALYTESTVQMIQKLHERFRAEGLLPA